MNSTGFTWRTTVFTALKLDLWQMHGGKKHVYNLVLGVEPMDIERGNVHANTNAEYSRRVRGPTGIR